jgi:hypothetical protein
VDSKTAANDEGYGRARFKEGLNRVAVTGLRLWRPSRLVAGCDG